MQSSQRSSRGYVTIFIVVVLGLLALFAARQATVATVGALRTVTVAQSNIISIYAAEVAMVEALETVNPFAATGWTSGSTVNQGSRAYTTNYCVTATSASDQFRVFARAEAGAFKATISQYVIVRDNTPYLIPGTWTDTDAGSC